MHAAPPLTPRRVRAQTLLHPFDVIKTVEQASKQKLGMMQAIKKVCRAKCRM